MSDRSAETAADTVLRLDRHSCDREPHSHPGRDPAARSADRSECDGLLVTHASKNLLSILGKSAVTVLGRPLAEAVGKPASQMLSQTGVQGAAGARRSYMLAGPNGSVLHLEAFRSGCRICVDIEPVAAHALPSQSVSNAQLILDGFRQASTPAELCDIAVQGIRAITGYDRVIVYHFHPAGHGEVIAEACATGVEPYLGICYPASDIPLQARQQYLHQAVGTISDACYQPEPLLIDPVLDDGTALDLTHSTLRSVSPVHRQYMRNMGTAASLTIALTAGQKLWGMLVCHHQTPFVAGPDLRALAGMVGQIMSLLLVSLSEANRFVRQHERQAELNRLVGRFAPSVPLADILAASERELLRLVDATGAVVSYDGTLHCLGRTPKLADVERALATLLLVAGDTILAIDDLGVRYPSLASCSGEASGALLLPLSQGTNDAILWFRPEHARTVNWGGNPAEHATKDPVSGEPSPRTSFAVWKETVRFRSRPWEEIDLALARDLKSVVDVETARRTKAELASLREVYLAVDEPNQQRTQELEEFAYAASHDLKAPLRAIEHLAEWIGEDLDATSKPAAIENIKLLKGRVRRLQFLLDGLLAYSRVGRQIDTVAEDINVAALLQEIVAQLGAPKGFAFVWPKNLPVIHTFRVLIGVVLTNLIGNAVKHHDRDEGRITVTMRLHAGLAEFRVSDDGPGIAPQFHDRIFLVFQTLMSRDVVEASGIGLAIVKKMVLSNGGRIWIESSPPARGSTFVFTWKDTVPAPSVQ